MTGSLLVQRLTDDDLWARVAGQARSAGSGLDPDQWYPVSTESAQACHEAAAAIAVCAGCPVRAQCLELSLRHWDIGQHGVWGGLVATDRADLRRRRARSRVIRRGGGLDVHVVTCTPTANGVPATTGDPPQKENSNDTEDTPWPGRVRQAARWGPRRAAFGEGRHP
jgi:WhiB family redox-sensing transcriptional regulator